MEPRDVATCRWRVLGPFLGLLFLVPSLGWANAFELYGLGSRSAAMAGAQCAVADDFAAVYYNPAGLPQIDHLDAGVGFHLVGGRFRELPDIVVGESTDSPGDPEIGTVRPQMSDNGGYAGGFAVGLADSVAIGVALYVPSHEFLAKLRNQDQRQPHMVMFDERPERFGLLIGAGWRVWGGLHVGAGLNVMFGPRGEMHLRILSGTEDSADLALTFRPRASPYGGLLYQLSDEMSFAAVYREPLRHGELDLDVTAEMPLGEILLDLSSIIFYSPRQVTLGWSWRPLTALRVSLAASWLQWSQFEDASLTVSGGFANSRDLPFRVVVPPRFRDSFDVKGGAEYSAVQWDGLSWVESFELLVRGGYHYGLSPVPEQKGLTNYLDSDAHIFSLGLGAALANLLQTERSFSLDAHVQVHHLPVRRHTKRSEMLDLDGDGATETRVLGYPGYEAGGTIVSGGLTLGVSF